MFIRLFVYSFIRLKSKSIFNYQFSIFNDTFKINTLSGVIDNTLKINCYIVNYT